jgi:hypothetical protein
MDNTSRLTKICRRISDIEYAFECNDMGEWAKESMRDELVELEEEYEIIIKSNKVANDATLTVN